MQVSLSLSLSLLYVDIFLHVPNLRVPRFLYPYFQASNCTTRRPPNALKKYRRDRLHDGRSAAQTAKAAKRLSLQVRPARAPANAVLGGAPKTFATVRHFRKGGEKQNRG